ncbi:MAG: domain containing rane protein [Myxococcales bacterium]|nr:domain containing rane protein [Myxococcales bacterium]
MLSLVMQGTRQARRMQVDRAMLERSIAFALRARDFMQINLLTVTPETPVLDIHRLFVEEEIHGAPVVDDEGVVHGVVSTLDLLRIERDEADPSVGATTAYFRDDRSYRRPSWTTNADELEARLDDVTAADVMTRELVTVTPDTPVAEVAQTMRDQHIHRVLVVEDRELVGVITSFDLLRAFIREAPRLGQPIDYDPSA